MTFKRVYALLANFFKPVSLGFVEIDAAPRLNAVKEGIAEFSPASLT